MTLGLNIAFPLINVLGNVWGTNPSCARVYPTAPGCFRRAERICSAHSPPEQQLSIIIFFFRAPCWELLPGLGVGEPEQSPDAGKAPLTDKTFKIWLQGGFYLHNAAMLGCDRLPTQVWKVWICFIHEISSFPFPSLPVHLLFWERI